MKMLLISIFVCLSQVLFSQSDWKKEKRMNYSIEFPASWVERESQNATDLMVSGVTPEFAGKDGYIGTTLFVSVEKQASNSLDESLKAYLLKLSETDFLKDVSVKKEKKVSIDGVEAYEIDFTAIVDRYRSACRIYIFQYNGLYYELSVTYDQSLSNKLKNEAFKVLQTFRFE